MIFKPKKKNKWNHSALELHFTVMQKRTIWKHHERDKFKNIQIQNDLCIFQS
jgi:hypothetical protein